MHHPSKKLLRVCFWIVPTLLLYGAFAPSVFAASISPSGPVYPGASYSVNETVTNSDASAMTVHNDWFYQVNGGSWNSWCSQDNTVPADGSVTVSCGSTGDVAGTVMEFQVNTWWNPWTVTWSNTGFTVQSRPVATASISGPSSISYNTAAFLSVSSQNASNCSVSGGGSWYSIDTYRSSGTWYTGNLTSDAAFTVTCTPNSDATGTPSDSFTVRVNPPPVVTYTLSTSAGTGGTVSGGGSYNSGTSVTVTAQPSDGYEFTGWGGIYAGRSNPFTLTMDGDRSVSASFSRVSYSLSVSTNGSGSVSCNGGSCASSYPSGTTVALSASPANDYTFREWTGDCSGDSCSVTMHGSRSVTANFAPVVSSGERSDFVKEDHWAVLGSIGTGQRCSSPYLNGVCDKILPVITSVNANNRYAPGASFRVTGSSGFIKGYTNEVGLSLSYPGFSQSGIVQFGPYRPGSKIIDFDFGPFTLPSQPGTYQIRMTISFLFGANGRLEWFSGYLPVTVAQPVREILYPHAVTGPCETPGTINLSWTKADATKWAGYKILRYAEDPLTNTSASSQEIAVIRDITETTYTDTTPQQNTRYWYRIETLTRVDLGAQRGSRSVAAVLLAQAGAGIQSAHTGRIPGPSGDDPGTLSSGPCPTVLLQVREADKPGAAFSGNPIVIDFTKRAELKWTSQNTKTCKATPGTAWSGEKTPASGGTEITPPLAPSLNLFKFFYRIECTGQ